VGNLLTTVGFILEHEFFMSFYGLFAWFAFNWAKRKREMGKRLPFQKWWRENVTDILLGVIVAYAIVAWDDELVEGYNSFVENDITLQRWMYFLPGFLTGRIMKWIFKDSENGT
jgi:hypothetical protein